MSSDGPTRSKLALRGSAKLVSEFFEYSINSVLYQRGIYPPEDFKVVKKYGLNILVTTDEEVKGYIKRIMGQLSRWMKDGKISKLVMAIISKDTGEVLERWQFDVHIFGKHSPLSTQSAHPEDQSEKENQEFLHLHAMLTKTSSNRDLPPQKEKTEVEIHAEIQAIIRQITASVTFLPMLEGRCTFNVLVYADADAKVPDEEWGDSDAKEVKNAENVKLRSFSTMNHRIDTMVSYRLDAEEY